ncbi:hypothetical protein [Methylophaga thalassica]|uniref:hypothetical protein n=1 Tax=Methylophaga aminisulfidivorans TaxID=230105 RepID=UPI003A921FD2
MHNQLKSGLFIALFLCTMGVSYAAEDRMDPAALENAMKSCRDSAKGSVELFDSCMQQKGFNHQPSPSIPAPPKAVDEKLKSAIQDCHETSKADLAAFESCMETKGFNKPRIETPN